MVAAAGRTASRISWRCGEVGAGLGEDDRLHPIELPSLQRGGDPGLVLQIERVAELPFGGRPRDPQLSDDFRRGGVEPAFRRPGLVVVEARWGAAGDFGHRRPDPRLLVGELVDLGVQVVEEVFVGE
jgi:hypothetical protein